jgi:hypothetical protein
VRRARRRGAMARRPSGRPQPGWHAYRPADHPAYRPAEYPTGHSTGYLVDRAAEYLADRAAEYLPDRAAEYLPDRAAEYPADHPANYPADDPADRPADHPANRPAGTAGLPSWTVEVALTVERPAAAGSGGTGIEAQALLLFRAPARAAGLVSALVEAAAEVEAAAGVGRPAGRWLVPAAELPGLAPVSNAGVLAHLDVAGIRGLAPPARRRQPVVGPVERIWRSSPGSVLTCEGPGGTSAQAVVALHGLGDVGAISPPPGGALVLRAWRARRTWGLACGLVLGATEALGLGRAAGRYAAAARVEGWHPAVLTGSAALAMARAGDPRQPAPEATAHSATEAEVMAFVYACLSIGDLDRPATGPD